MATLIRGGTVVTADQSYRADVLCDQGLIKQATGRHVFEQRGEAPVVHCFDRLENICLSAYEGFDDAAAFDGALQFGAKPIGRGLTCHVALDTAMLLGILRVQAHHRLYQW